MNSGRTYLGAVLIGIAGLLFFVLVMPTYDGISARRAALDQRTQMVNDDNAVIAKLNDFKKQSADRAADIKEFSNIVPATKDGADLVSMLQALASQNGLQMTTLAMGSTANTQDSPYSDQSLDIGLNGGYVAFRSFVDDMEKNVRIIDVDSIDAAPVTEGSPTISFKVKAHAYFLP